MALDKWVQSFLSDNVLYLSKIKSGEVCSLESEVCSLKSLKSLKSEVFDICAALCLCALSVHLLYHPSPMAAAVVVKEIGENVDDKGDDSDTDDMMNMSTEY